MYDLSNGSVFQWPWVTIGLDFKVTYLVTIGAVDVLCAQPMRDLFAIVKFLL